MSPLLIAGAWVAVGLGIGSALVIAWDILGRGHRLRMAVMELVWPVTALYLGPIAWLAYRRWRVPAGAGRVEERPMEVATTLAVSHCGAGCTIGDIIGSVAVFVFALELAGLALWAELAIDFALAFSLGIVVQYLTIAPMRGLGLRDGLIAALKADTLSLVAFEIGLFGWMILVQLVFFPDHVRPDSPVFWFMMQIGMALGFLTAWPVNRWLIEAGLKERM